MSEKLPKSCNQIGDIIKSALSLWDANSSRYTFSQVIQTQEGHVTVKLAGFYSGSIHSGIPAPEKAHWKWGSWEVLTKTCLSSPFSSPYCKNRRETKATVHILSIKCQMHQDQAASFTERNASNDFFGENLENIFASRNSARFLDTAHKRGLKFQTGGIMLLRASWDAGAQ